MSNATGGTSDVAMHATTVSAASFRLEQAAPAGGDDDDAWLPHEVASLGHRAVVPSAALAWSLRSRGKSATGVLAGRPRGPPSSM